MDTASQLAQTGLKIPTQQVAGFTPTQQQAFGEQQKGIGKYQDYINAAVEMLDSKWAKQTPNRANGLADIVREHG